MFQTLIDNIFCEALLCQASKQTRQRAWLKVWGFIEALLELFSELKYGTLQTGLVQSKALWEF